MSDNVRVRFAPSPTGPLHIGGFELLYSITYMPKIVGNLYYELRTLTKSGMLKIVKNTYSIL